MNVDDGESDSTYHYSFRNSDEELEVENDAVYEKYQKRQEKKKARKNISRKLAKVAAYGLVFGLVAGAAFTGVNYGLERMGLNIKSTTQLASTQTVSTKSSNATNVSEVAQNALPAVVSITGTFQVESYGYFGNSSSESEGSGSGIIVAKDDNYIYIATNNHVVEDATSLAVGFCDDTTVEAEIKGTDSDADLAVVTVDLSKVEQSTLDAIKIIMEGDSDELVVGEQAIAIGNALGYGQSVTAGYISAVNREVELTDKTMTLIQTDAAINPGNSGGALLNSNGELIGINTVKYASEDVEGMGYAIPINTAKTIIDDLINEKTIPESQQAYLGISGREISSDMAQAYNMPSGIYVSEVMENSPAQDGGIRAGDIITEFDGNSVTSMESLQNRISKKSAGTSVTIKVQRQSQMGGYSEQTLKVTLGNKSQMQTQSYGSQGDTQ
ncbi:MAG TPA: trypsin-like peptidase domain-containing protein [Candidatus Fimousia stercorigallinarum]|nr:trypsin-like peptidase domain-containing protein [Candidatus Fimousia stercorigallinarum]